MPSGLVAQEGTERRRGDHGPEPLRPREREADRRGLTQLGAWLVATSASNRTSPVNRGRFILEQLSPMKEVEKIRSSFALKQVRYKTALPLRDA